MKRTGYTLAEVLITLGIIGVVAALVMPSLIANYKDKVYDAARKKAWSTIGQAMRVITVNGGIAGAANAQDFVENHLREQIKILKTCDNNNLRSCGIETNTNAIKTLTGTSTTMPKTLHDLAPYMSWGETTQTNTTSYGFVMANGYSVNLFYNPKCLHDDTVSPSHHGQDRVCVNAVYDMNGLGKPNQAGKDIGFITVLYPDESSVAYAPDVVKENAAVASTFNNAPQACTNQNPDYSVPNRDELLAMYMNGNLIGITSGEYWSASEAPPDFAWSQDFAIGGRSRFPKTHTNEVRCIRR
ncbi:MAG: prepilin-type N-terminal cleavage/methylation domain-containing protein [Heliobacteriaceae bacterium]|jgi:prepilin-type N-terminal cleavage/methylation domain-containing protein|nr:prepilin-type N-terminal cleavage/methylation domain-containing protein [Heliobacteriaceae bacterium]